MESHTNEPDGVNIQQQPFHAPITINLIHEFGTYDPRQAQFCCLTINAKQRCHDTCGKTRMAGIYDDQALSSEILAIWKMAETYVDHGMLGRTAWEDALNAIFPEYAVGTKNDVARQHLASIIPLWGETDVGGKANLNITHKMPLLWDAVLRVIGWANNDDNITYIQLLNEMITKADSRCKLVEWYMMHILLWFDPHAYWKRRQPIQRQNSRENSTILDPTPTNTELVQYLRALILYLSRGDIPPHGRFSNLANDMEAIMTSQYMDKERGTNHRYILGAIKPLVFGYLQMTGNADHTSWLNKLVRNHPYPTKGAYNINIVHRSIDTQFSYDDLFNINLWEFGLRSKHCPHACDVPNHLYRTLRIRHSKDLHWLKILDRLFPPTSAADAGHQTITLSQLIREMYYVANKEQSVPQAYLGHVALTQAINRVLSYIPIGTNQILTMSLLITALYHSSKQYIISDILKTNTLFGSYSAQRDRLDALNTYHRNSARNVYGQVLTAQDISGLAYLNLAFGRSKFTTDWVAELENRTTYTWHIRSPKCLRINGNIDEVINWTSDADNTPTGGRIRDPIFYERLKDKLLKYATYLVKHSNTKESFSDFAKRRHEWVASGSSAGHKVEVDSLVIQSKKSGTTIPVNKRIWAEGLTHKQMIGRWHHEKPTEVAHASEKMENGKARAIYGVEPWHYVVNTYATKGFEERLKHIPGLEKGAGGASAVALQYLRASLSGDNNLEMTMLDYADFNRHHTPEAQALVFQSFAEIGHKVKAHPDWIRANQWVAEAKYNMGALFPGNNSPKRVVQGMFSGTRSTDLINTLLNLAYFEMANDKVTDLGIRPKELYNVHQGDDVWLSNKSQLWARLLYYTLNDMGFIFSKRKQMFGTGRGEYLRVLYQEGKAIGYHNRALVNFLLRPLQNRPTEDASHWAQTIGEGTALLHRRGLSLEGSTVLYTLGLSKRAIIKAHPLDTEPIVLPLNYIETAPELGGLGVAAPGRAAITSQVWRWPKPPKCAPIRPVNHSTHMTDDWIEYVSGKGEDQNRVIRAQALKDIIIQDNFSDTIHSLKRDRGLQKYKSKLRRFIQHNKQLMNESSNSRIFRSANNAEEMTNAVLSSVSIPYRPSVYDPNYRAALLTVMNDPRAQVEVTRTSEDLQKLITRSRFKSEQRTATALGLNTIDAVRVIVQNAAENQEITEDLAATLGTIFALDDQAALDKLLTGSSSFLNPLRYWWNNDLLNLTASVISQALVKAGLFRGKYDPSLSTYYRERDFISSIVSTPQLSGMDGSTVSY